MSKLPSQRELNDTLSLETINYNNKQALVNIAKSISIISVDTQIKHNYLQGKCGYSYNNGVVVIYHNGYEYAFDKNGKLESCCNAEPCDLALLAGILYTLIQIQRG